MYFFLMRTPDGLIDPKIALRRIGHAGPALAGGRGGRRHWHYVALAIFLGGLGAHNWYAARYWPALGQLLLCLLGFGIGGPVLAWIWALVELMTVGTDGDGRPLA